MKDKLNISSTIFMGIGIVLVVMGLWFIFIRPTIVFLPEDEIFTGMSSSILLQNYPNLFTWSGLVFRSWGSFIVVTGVYTFFLGFKGIRNRERWAWVALLLGGVFNLSMFLTINVILNGDYVWLIASLLFGQIFSLIISFNPIFKNR